MTMDLNKHPVEDKESWTLHLARQKKLDDGNKEVKIPSHRRQLKHHHKHHDKDKNPREVEEEAEQEFWDAEQKAEEKARKKRKKKERKRKKKMKVLYSDPGIQQSTEHGMMIDAGSTGSRLHIYEWDPRILRDSKDVQEAVSGRKLSFPGTESRWTERLHPGLSEFAKYEGKELEHRIADYLEPLVNFAKTILHEKEAEFKRFPIFLRATAGMRILKSDDRARVINAVRKLFSNDTYCPFYFEDEQARVLSGEEESIYDWTGVNFLMGNLLEESKGSGTVLNPKKTYGALDLGGGSTQIAFYEPNEDIMADLFKLQIGQGKHWNVYTHSFLYYGINEATHRFQARLADGKSASERLVDGVYDPCLPGGSSQRIRTNIHVDDRGVETWDYTEKYASGTGFFEANLVNNEDAADYEKCSSLVKELLHLEQNAWCNFDHRGDCSFAGVYQPVLPTHQEYMTFSNYYHIAREFLNLPERFSIGELKNATRYACSLSKEETITFNDGRIGEDEVESYCFRSVYALELLQGYGFREDDHVSAARVVGGHKLGWAIGAMLYEINTLPWKYDKPDSSTISYDDVRYDGGFNILKWELVSVFLLVLFAVVLYCRRQRTPMHDYEPVKEVQESVQLNV